MNVVFFKKIFHVKIVLCNVRPCITEVEYTIKYIWQVIRDLEMLQLFALERYEMSDKNYSVHTQYTEKRENRSNMM